MKDRPKIGLVLGAGGAKGIAHIGAISVLESAGIPIDLIVGCSMGAIIGGSYALGAKIEHMQKAAISVTRSDIMDLRLPDKFGFVKGDKAEKFIHNLILNSLNVNEESEILKNSKTDSKNIKQFMFSDCKIPFYCYATDFYKAEGVVLGRGKLLPAIRASFSIGGVFRPVKIGSKYLLDGSLTSRVPVDVARAKGADIVIAVDCVGPTKAISEDQINSYSETIIRIFFMMEYKYSKEEMNRADVLVQIPQDVDALRFKDLSKSIEYGKKYMTDALPRIKEIIKNYKPK